MKNVVVAEEGKRFEIITPKLNRTRSFLFGPCPGFICNGFDILTISLLGHCVGLEK